MSLVLAGWMNLVCLKAAPDKASSGRARRRAAALENAWANSPTPLVQKLFHWASVTAW